MNIKHTYHFTIGWVTIICCLLLYATLNNAQFNQYKIVAVDSFGWANNSINVTVFRKNSLVSFGDTQYIAYYNKDSYVVLGKRKINEKKWTIRQTQYKGNTNDAHNIISIMVDGAGYLHLSWDHHGNKLNYCKSIAPSSLEMTDRLPITGLQENSVTYPEFYRMPNGNLIFLYRDGASGRGNLVLNSYDIQSKKWQQLQSSLIDGEGKRNAYWQACVDKNGAIHLSWVWRESPDVSSNHDLCYAISSDGGKTWCKSSSEKYALPITAKNAEYICSIPQKSELINQTSMTTDDAGHPYIATYWKENEQQVPQYHIVFKTNNVWQSQNLSFRKTNFSLIGAGTKHISISRPQLIIWTKNKYSNATLIFRDEERGNRVSMAININLKYNLWTVKDISTESVGAWEPSFDTELWKEKRLLHLFIQNANQGDGEKSVNAAPQVVKVLECKL